MVRTLVVPEKPAYWYRCSSSYAAMRRSIPYLTEITQLSSLDSRPRLSRVCGKTDIRVAIVDLHRNCGLQPVHDNVAAATRPTYSCATLCPVVDMVVGVTTISNAGNVHLARHFEGCHPHCPNAIPHLT